MAKRPVLTAELIDDLCEALDIPMAMEDACRMVGLSYRAVKRWLDAADDEDCEDPLLLELSKRVAAVMGSASHKRGELLSMAFAMAAADPKTALALLTKLNPAFNETKNVKIDAVVQPKAISLDLSKCSPEELDAIEAGEAVKRRLMSGDA